MSRAAKDLISENIGTAIAKHRKAIGMTQAELAERLDLSIDAVSRLELGNIGLSVLRLFELAEIFGCETVDLLESGSSRPRDQARQLEALLSRVDENKRFELLRLVEQIVVWSQK